MPTTRELTQQQKAQWSAAAPGWERSSAWFDRNSADLVNWICDAAGVQPGHIVLDVACGAGQPSVTAAQRVRPDGRVIATDLSPQMADVTRRRAQRLGLDNLDAREMDAQALAFADASFDAATCRFGLMFCPEPVRAASEVRRVLKPGARFALAVWDAPEKIPSSRRSPRGCAVRADAASRSGGARGVSARASRRARAGAARGRLLQHLGRAAADDAHL